MVIIDDSAAAAAGSLPLTKPARTFACAFVWFYAGFDELAFYVKKSGPSRFSPTVALNSTVYYCRSCTADYAARYLELRTAQETSWLPGFQLLPPVLAPR